MFFGFSAMSSLCSSLRVSRKLRLISSNLYLLSINVNLSRDASRLSGSSFFYGLLKYMIPFMNPWKTELGWQDVRSRYWYVSVGLVILISSMFESESLPLYAVESRNVVLGMRSCV